MAVDPARPLKSISAIQVLGASALILIRAFRDARSLGSRQVVRDGNVVDHQSCETIVQRDCYHVDHNGPRLSGTLGRIHRLI